MTASPKKTTGEIHAVPCPHCGAPNDFRDQSTDKMLETGSTFDCDHCHHYIVVTRVKPTTLVSVQQHPTLHGRAPEARAPAAQQAYTIALRPPRR